MQVLCVGDIHVKVSNVPEIDQLKAKLNSLAEKLQPRFIVLLGDILDRHATIHVSCLMRAEAIVYELSQLAPVFLLVGNHDRPNNSNYLTNEHPFGAIKRWSNVYVIDQVRAFTINSEMIQETSQVIDKDGFRFVFAPYVPPGRFSEALGTIVSPYSCRAVFAHQEIKGAKMGAIISEEGDVWALERPLLVSGHIHDYDFLQENMIYTGTPLMHGFGDKSDKTVSLFHFHGSGENWSQERIDLGLIKKITVYIEAKELEKYRPPQDKLVRLVVRGDQAAVQSAMKLSAVNKLKSSGVKIVFKTVSSTTAKPKFQARTTYRERLSGQLDPEELAWLDKICPK